MSIETSGSPHSATPRYEQKLELAILVTGELFVATLAECSEFRALLPRPILVFSQFAHKFIGTSARIFTVTAFFGIKMKSGSRVIFIAHRGYLIV